jgi:hypothetical protein
MRWYSFLRFPDFKTKAVTLSYDDGVIYDKPLIEIMDKNGLKGTFNINSALFATCNGLRMPKDEALELYRDSGHEVAVHGKRHRSLAEFPDPLVLDDVLNDRIALEEMFERIITGMAYAGGSYDDRVVELLKGCGIEYARTTNSTETFAIPTDWLRLPATCHHGNPRLMELAHKFVEEPDTWQNVPRLFYLWGHSYEFNDNNNWHVIEEFAEYIGNRPDVWYATNIDICHYVKAFDALQFSAAGDRIYNPTATDIYLHYANQDICVKAGETVKIQR